MRNTHIDVSDGRDLALVTEPASAEQVSFTFYRAMQRRARYCHGKLSVCNVEVSWSYNFTTD